MSKDTEERLRALEERARNDLEQWGAVKAEINALSAALDCIIKPIGAALDIRVLRTIVKNLETFESVSRADNQQSAMISRFRQLRQIFESQLQDLEQNAK